MSRILITLFIACFFLAFFGTSEASGANPKVLLKTSKGDITLELYADRNDKASVRLCRIEDAPSLFGYKRSPEAKKAESEKP